MNYGALSPSNSSITSPTLESSDLFLNRLRISTTIHQLHFLKLSFSHILNSNYAIRLMDKMETTPSIVAATTIRTIDPDSSSNETIETIAPDSRIKTTIAARTSTPPRALTIWIPPHHSTSPISIVESVFSSRSSVTSPRSLSTSPVSPTYDNETPEQDIASNETPTRDPCLQCSILGLRCSFSSKNPRTRRREFTPGCRRCAGKGEEFCVWQKPGSEYRDGGSKYCAEGVESEDVQRRVEELLEPKRESMKWCLPKIPLRARANLKPVQLLWAGK